MKKLFLTYLTCLCTLATFSQDFRLEEAQVSANYDVFAPFRVDSQLVYCSNKKLSTWMHTKDVSGMNPVHWMSENKIWNFNEALALGHFSLGSADYCEATKEFVYCANVPQSQAKKNQVLGIYFLKDGMTQQIPFDWNARDFSYDVAHPTLSITGDTLVFSSNRTGGKGGSDLYFSVREGGEWSQPLNLEEINTAGNEYFAKIHPSGDLYFSSNGYPNAQKLDIYKSSSEGDGWKLAQPLTNLNSEGNDYGVEFSSDGFSGWISSDRDGRYSRIFSMKEYLPVFEECKPSLREPTCYLIEETKITQTDTLPIRFEWDFGDGTTAPGLSNEHCFPGVGDYNVALNIYDTLSNAKFASVSQLFISIPNADIPLIEGEQQFSSNTNQTFKANLEELVSVQSPELYWKVDDGRWTLMDSLAVSFETPGEHQVYVGASQKVSGGKRVNRCAVTSVVVVEGDAVLAQLPEEKAIPAIEAMREGEVEGEENEVMYFVEIHESEEQVTLNDPVFEGVEYEITERYKESDKQYHYSIGESENLLSMRKMQTEMQELGFSSALISDEILGVYDEAIVKKGFYYTDEVKAEMNAYVEEISNIHFDVNSAKIQKVSFENLQNVAKVLSERKDLRLFIHAHTDDQGTDKYNKELSQKRAEAVVDYLLKKGVGEERMQFRGYGNDKPLIEGSTPEARQANRRVEFEIIFPVR